MSEPEEKPAYKLKVVGDLDFYEVVEAFKKALREHKTYDACFWAFLLNQSDYYKFIFKTLAYYASRQIGNNDPKASIIVSSLWSSYNLCIVKANRKTEEALGFIFQAIAYLCQSDENIEKLVYKVIDNYCARRWLKTKQE